MSDIKPCIQFFTFTLHIMMPSCPALRDREHRKWKRKMSSF